MAHAGQELDGPGGLRLRLLEVTPELLAMEASYPASAGMPPMHLHPAQAERFEVLEGRVATVIGNAERTYAAGETFEVPADTPHRMGPAEGPARMRWEVRPALRTAEFFERLYSGAAAANPQAFLAEYAAEFRLT